MDRALIVEQLLDQCKRFVESMLQASDLPHVAAASLAIFTQLREGAREILPAQIELEAAHLWGQEVPRCCGEATLQDVHTRTVSPTTLCGAVTIPGRPFQCGGCGATRRPDDALLGVPAAGDCTDDVRTRSTPLVAELPHRVAHDIFGRFTGVALSSRGAQGLIDRTAQALRTWDDEHAVQDATTVADVVAAGAGARARRVEIALDGVKAPIDGRWQEPKVATILVRQLPAGETEPPLGAVLARRSVCILGTAEALVAGITQGLQGTGGERLPVGAILGDGAPWIWNVADAHVPGGRQTLDSSHLREHLSALAHLQFPRAPARAKAWVEHKSGALLTDRVGAVLSGLTRMRPRTKTVRAALAQLLGSVEHNRTRIRYQEPWHRGVAVGSGAVAGACQHVMQTRFKRAGMRWKQHGFLNVLALRIARLNTT